MEEVSRLWSKYPGDTPHPNYLMYGVFAVGHSAWTEQVMKRRE